MFAFIEKRFYISLHKSPKPDPPSYKYPLSFLDTRYSV